MPQKQFLLAVEGYVIGQADSTKFDWNRQVDTVSRETLPPQAHHEHGDVRHGDTADT